MKHLSFVQNGISKQQHEGQGFNCNALTITLTVLTPFPAEAVISLNECLGRVCVSR